MKIAAAAVVLFMGYWIKYLLSKNARLEHKDKINDKLNAIRENQEVFKDKALVDEKIRIDEKIKTDNDKSIRDELNGL